MSAKPKALIIRAPGTNCEHDTAYAFSLAGAEPTVMHVNQVISSRDRVDDFQILCVPGGFSYGDDVAAGKVLAAQLEHNLSDVLRNFHAQGKLILGICNGFQVLIKSGLFFDETSDSAAATLTWNDSGRYLDAWVHLHSDSDLCVFLKGIDLLELPIAHAEGRFVALSDDELKTLDSNGQLAIRYCKPEGPNGKVPYPMNPNGSQADVAGICDSTGRVFGLMPHPERNIDPTHHPNWTRGDRSGGSGLKIFKNAVAYFG